MTTPIAGEREALLPCPFCQQSTARMYPPTCDKRTPYNPADRAFPVVRCPCGAEKSGSDWDQSGRSAIESWNRRAALLEPVGEALSAPAVETVAVQEATPAMLEAGAMEIAMNEQRVVTAERKAENVWRAMMRAAPLPVAPKAEPSFITAMIDARRKRYAMDQSCTPAFLNWLDTVAPREGVGANEAWNAGVAWAQADSAQPVADRSAEALARMLPIFEKLLKDVVFTTEKAGQVLADMNTLRAAMGTPQQAEQGSNS